LKAKARKEKTPQNKSLFYEQKIRPAIKDIKFYRGLYWFIIPALVWYFIFWLIPLYGITLAFKDFNYRDGLFGNDWVGLKYFKTFIANPQFWMMIRNTLTISILKMILCFPVPIIFALMLNEIQHPLSKRIMQTISYLPHFVSWVIIVAILNKFISPYGGLINELREKFFGLTPHYYMGDTKWFYPLIILTHNYKTMGFSSILYLSAIAGIDQELYEAAYIDGAGKMRSLLSITLPCIKPTIVLNFILNIGGLLAAGFDQIYLMTNPSNEMIANVLDVYSINVGIKGGNFSLATAVGLFTSAISFLIVWATNRISRRISEISLW